MSRGWRWVVAFNALTEDDARARLRFDLSRWKSALALLLPQPAGAKPPCKPQLTGVSSKPATRPKRVQECCLFFIANGRKMEVASLNSILVISMILLAALGADPASDAVGKASEEAAKENPVLKLQVGKPVDVQLLNRATWFFPDPTRRSGVIVFCDDGQGTTVGVVATDLRWEANDAEDGWRQERRFWQEKDWSLNVTNFGWSEDGLYLFIATCDIYGSGNVYQLDMVKRKSSVLFSPEMDDSLKGHCWSSRIDAIDKDSITIHVEDYCDKDKVFVRRTLTFPSPVSVKE